MNFHVGTEDCKRAQTLGQTNTNKQCIIHQKSTVPKSAKRPLNPLFIHACCAASCCSAAAWCECVPPFSLLLACQRSQTLGQTNINKQKCIIELKLTVPKSAKRFFNPLFIRACCAAACCSVAEWCKCVPLFSWWPAKDPEL